MTTLSQHEPHSRPHTRPLSRHDHRTDSPDTLVPDAISLDSQTAKPTRNHSWRFVLWLSLPVIAILAFAIFQPILVLPRMGLSPGFGLTNYDGQRITNEDLRGHIVLYNFTYSNCSAPCPQTTATMAAIQQSLKDVDLQGIPVALATISFDPDRDRPDVLKALVQRYTDSDAQSSQAKPTNAPWYFLTGDPLPLKYVIGGGFGAYYQANDDGSFTFEPTFVLVDGAGIIRAKYRTATPDLTIIQRDLGLIATEAVESTGATRLAYEAAHLFLCYPK